MPRGIYKRTKETKNKISITVKKLWQNPEYREKNKTFTGHKHSEESKNKMSEIKIGIKSSEITKKVWQNPEYREKQIKAHIGKEFTEETKKKMSKAHIGKNNHMYGKHHTKKWKEEHSKTMKDYLSNPENHPNWQGGISFEPYSPKFNGDLKEFIRNRDNRICQLDSKTEKENKQKLCVHHIDYDKKNCNFENLISLCRICNSKVNFNRNYWTEYFQGVINAYN